MISIGLQIVVNYLVNRTAHLLWFAGILVTREGDVVNWRRDWRWQKGNRGSHRDQS